MNKQTHLILLKRLFPILLSILLLTGCFGSSEVVPDEKTQKNITAENTHLAFAAFTDELFMQEVTSDSITLHYTVASPQALSIPETTPTLGSASEQERISSIEQTEKMLKKLKGFTYKNLSKQDKITYDILKWQFETVQSSKPFAYYAESLGATTGIQAQLPILFAEYEFYCSKDIEDYLLLLRQLPQYFEEIAAYESEKSNAGLFMAKSTVDQIVKQCNDFLCDVDSHYLTTTFNTRMDKLDWLSDEQKSQFKDLNRSTLTEYVYPAYESLMECLNTLKDSSKNENGLCKLPQGKEYYTYLVKRSTGSESTPEELIKRVQKQIQTDINSMSLLINASPSALDSVQEPLITYSEPDAILEHLKETIKKQFPAAPTVSYSVKYVDASLQEHLSPAFYLTPPIDRITQNVIYLNEPSFHDTIQLFTTLAHEGYPGHMYQNIYFQSTSPDKIRSLLSFPGYAEGYATYAELFSYDYMGLAPESSQLLKLSSSITLGLYAYLDLSIHYEGKTLEEAKNFLNKYGVTDDAAITQIYEAIVAEPANYLKYYVGYLEFLSLREKAESLWGDDFTDKRFHQYILQMGDAPFCVLEKYLE